MKKFFSLVILLISSCAFAINVELNINTGNMYVEEGQVINSETMNIITNPITIKATKNKLYYNTNNKVDSCESYLILGNPLVKFKVNHKDYIYKGKIKIHSKNGKIKFINIVDLEDYVEGVLKGELNSKYPIETLKAQAICIRTYGLNKTKTANYHLCDTHCQRYLGYNDNENLKRAARETAGYVIKYNGELISAMFYAHCGGWTNSWNKAHNTNNFPYLTSVRDTFHKDLKKWEYKIPIKSLSNKINFNFKSIKISSRYNNRVLEIEFSNDNKTKVISGDKLRNLLGIGNIKSTLFDFQIKDDLVVFYGAGYGHGYGLCQLGAVEMGKQGFSCRDILNFYYKGCSIVKE